MSFEEQAKKVIAELTEDDINALKDTQDDRYIDRLEEIVKRIFDFDYSDSKNYDKIKEIFPDIEDISQDGEVWSENGLDVEIPQMTKDDGHTVNLWLGLYAEEELLDDDKGIISPITLQFSLETVYDNHSEPWYIITRCVPLPNDKEIEAMKHFTKSEIEAMQSFTKENVNVEKDSDNHIIHCKVVEIIGNAISEVDSYMQYPIPVNTHGELYTDKNGNSIFLDGQGGVLVNGIPVPPETIVYDPNDPTRPLYKPELAGVGREQGQTQGTELEIFSYSYEHQNGDQYWTDYSKYIFKTDTEEIVKNYSDGYTLEEGTTVVPKDKFLEVVDTVEQKVRSSHKGYEIYNRLSDSNRALIERLLKQEQTKEMRTFDKADIQADRTTKDNNRAVGQNL